MKIIIQSIFKINMAFTVMLYLLCISSCNKLVETPPPSESIADENVYSTDASAIAVLNGIYISMNTDAQPFQGNQGVALLTGLSADELTLYNGVTAASNYYRYYTNTLSQSLGTTFSGAEYWSPLYNYIFRCNAALEGLQASTTLSRSVRQQLLGEAHFLRAFYYFYLVNLFGDLPLALTTDPVVNTLLKRSPQGTVYEQIITDLKKAEGLLSSDFLNGSLTSNTTERIRPTRWAATSLLSRVYLYTSDWLNAEAKASEVIDKNSLFILEPLNSVFMKNSKEAIWQLQPTAINFNTQEAQTLVIPQTGPNAGSNPVYLSDTLMNSFEPEDLRFKPGNWVDTTIYKVSASLNDTVAYPYKYKLNTLDPLITASTGTTNMKEYFMVLRLAEQYLIRAEAKLKLGNNVSAKDDLNVVRKRAFSPEKPVTTINNVDLLAAIMQERRSELFCEWGHRWLDLKRTNKINEVMSGITLLKSNGATTWLSYKQWFPLPLVSDLQKGPNLTQNDGY